MLFSVIIPAYNASAYLRETIRSLRAQVFKDFEAILVDDNSDDETLEIARESFYESGIAGLVLQKPIGMKAGVSTTRNYAIGHARGEWLIFLDSDDMFHPLKLQVVKDSIISNPDVLAFCHGYRTFQSPTEILLQEVLCPTIRPVDTSGLFLANSICTSTVALNRHLFESLGGFDCNLNGVEDYFLWLNVARRTTWHYVEAALSYYRVSANSLMGQRKLSYYVDQNSRLFKLARKNLFTSTELKSLHRGLFYDSLKYYVGRSILFYGYTDFAIGLIRLARVWEWKVLLYFLWRQFKHETLRIAHAMFFKVRFLFNAR